MSANINYIYLHGVLTEITIQGSKGLYRCLYGKIQKVYKLSDWREAGTSFEKYLNVLY